MIRVREGALDELSGVIEEVMDGTIHGARVPGAFPVPLLDRASEGLADAGFASTVLVPGEPPVVSHGLMLAPTEVRPEGPSFAEYLDAAERHEPLLHALIPGLRERVALLLSVLAGVPAEVPSAAGRTYATATIRELPPGRSIPLHNDTYHPQEGWAHLDALRDPTTRVSWYIGLSAPEAGGRLEVLTEAADYGGAGRGQPVDVLVGDLVFFDAGRLFHRVGEVGGTRPRLTLGGFCSLDKAGERLLFWG